MSKTLTHEELRKAAFACLRRPPVSWRNREDESANWGFGCSLVVSEIVSAAYEIPDAIGFRYGSSVMIECKCSRSDFLADAKKPHRLTGTGAGKERFFLTPPGLLKLADLPEHWGLLELHGKKISRIYEPKWASRELDQAAHISEKRMLLSLLSRIKAREFLFIDQRQMDSELCAEDAAA